MYLEQAKTILDRADISQQAKDLWAMQLVTNGEDIAREFVTTVGDDENLIRLATEFLMARFSVDETPVKGMMTVPEQDLVLDIIAREKSLQQSPA